MAEATSTLTITDATFDEAVLKSSKPVLVDFWAKWCGPCLMFAPTIDELAKEYDGKAIIGKVEIDENPIMQTQYEIKTIPTLVLFKNGKEVERLVGRHPKKEVQEKLDALL